VLRDVGLRIVAILIFLLGAAVLVFGEDTAAFRGNAQHTGVPRVSQPAVEK
jgi:hypothetical protein